MDNQLHSNDPNSSEMSASSLGNYRRTKNYAKHRKASWEVVRDSLRDTFGDVRVEVHTPMLLGMTSGMVVGPNDDLSAPDDDVGARLEFVTKTSSDPPPLGLLGVGVPPRQFSGVLVYVDNVETGRTILQGKTVISQIDAQAYIDVGNIYLRGALPGNAVYVNTSGADDGWKFLKTSLPAGKTDPIFVTPA